MQILKHEMNLQMFLSIRTFENSFSNLRFAGVDAFGKKIKKEISIITGSGITLTNNEIKDIKLIRSLENRGIFLKGTTRKVTSQERRTISAGEGLDF